MGSKKEKKEKQILTPQEKKEKQISSLYRWVRVILVMSSIAVYIGFALVWKEKWDNQLLFGDYTTLLVGILIYTYGILSHTYILHNFKVVPWIISLITCSVGISLIAGVVPYIIGAIVITMLILEALFNQKAFKDFNDKIKNKHKNTEPVLNTSD